MSTGTRLHHDFMDLAKIGPRALPWSRWVPVLAGIVGLIFALFSHNWFTIWIAVAFVCTFATITLTAHPYLCRGHRVAGLALAMSAVGCIAGVIAIISATNAEERIAGTAIIVGALIASVEAGKRLRPRSR